MWKGAAEIFKEIETKIKIKPIIRIMGISGWSIIYLLIDEKSVEPTNPYIKLEPNKKIQVDKLPIIKYFTPASEEIKSSRLKETNI